MRGRCSPIPGNSALPNRWLVGVWLAASGVALQAQTYRVETEKTITIEVPGATAAFVLNATYADASAENGVVTVTGKIAGTTHVMVVTAAGPQPYEVVVTNPAVKHLSGFLNAEMLHMGIESGYVDSRYNSSPGQIQDQLDFSRRQDDNITHMHLVGTEIFGPLFTGESRTQLSSASYEISTPERDITILDQYREESPLGINGSIVRGLHFRDDGWFVHAGYTSIASFEGLFLPTKAERAIEAGYQHSLGDNSTIIGTLYDFKVTPLDVVGKSGVMGMLTYAYSPSENFHLSADLGVSHGIGESFRLDYTGTRDRIRGLFRNAPMKFAALGTNNLHGLRSDINWTHHVTSKLDGNVTFYSNQLSMPGIRQSNENAAVQGQYQLTSHWSLFGGGTASNYKFISPSLPPVRSIGAPAGLGFNTRYFGAQGQYQFTRISGQDSGGRQYRGMVHGGVAGFTVSAFAQQQTQAPTLSFILSQDTGLQQILDQLGITATSIQQIDELLSNNAFLFAAGYVKGATINLIPLRSQLGATMNWMPRGVNGPELSYNYLYNDDHSLTNTQLTTDHSLVYLQKFHSEELYVSYSLLNNKTPGLSANVREMLSVGWRHTFHTVPSFIIPERHGSISGIVFQDDNSKGSYETGMPLLSGAQVRLDDSRKLETGADGSYNFSRVPLGKHRVVVSYKSDRPIFFSTPSEVEVNEDSTVNFGIGHLLSGIVGRLNNDAEQGVMGVDVTVRNKDKKWTTSTDGDGAFFLRQLTEGEYEVEFDSDSVPPGYLTAELETQHVKVGATSPGTVEVTIRALRSIGGQVLRYESGTGKYAPVAGAKVTLKETGKSSTTDAAGRYLFRDLPAGAYTLSATVESQTIKRTVKLPASPMTLTNIDLQVGGTSPVPAPSTSPQADKPDPPSAIESEPTAPTQTDSPAKWATPAPLSSVVQEHDRIGRQRMGAGRYKEAIAEFTEAIRLDRRYAPAYNARGFAWYKLAQFSRSLDDLDKALELSPNYINAYRNRAVVRRAAGDLSGSRADFQREAMFSSSVGTTLMEQTKSSSQPTAAAPSARETLEPAPRSAVSITSATAAGKEGARAHAEAARRLIKAFQFREAIAELDTAIQLDSGFAQAYNARGFAWFKLSDFERALRDLDTAIRLKPDYGNAIHNRGVVRKATGDSAGAEADRLREEDLAHKTGGRKPPA